MNTADVSFLHHLNGIKISRTVLERKTRDNQHDPPPLLAQSWSPVISVVVIKLSIINDICQAIACSSDCSSLCIHLSSNQLLSYPGLIAIKQAKLTVLRPRRAADILITGR